METAFGFLIGSVVMLGWIFLFGYAFRNRIKIGNWLKAPDYFNVQIPDRKTALERYIVKQQWVIEDSRTELELIEAQGKKTDEVKS